MKLNLACGFDKKPGWVNTDIGGVCSPDVLMDALKTPWPFADNEAEEVLISHFLEHVPHQIERDDGQRYGRDGFFVVMDELYRVCGPGAMVEIRFPSAFSLGFAIDPTHTRPLLPDSFNYCDAAWRKQCGFAHYPVNCDFVLDGMAEVVLGREQKYLDVLLAGFTDPVERRRAAIRHLVDTVEEWRMHFRAVKPSR